MSKLMELVDSYAKSLMCEHLEWSAEHDATRAALNAAVQELERDAADGARFVAFMSAFRTQDYRFLTAVHDALPEDGESLDYIRAAIDAAMEAAK